MSASDADRRRWARQLHDQTQGNLHIEVTDDGAGFDAGAQPGGFGLAGMRERVYLAGGSVEVESAKTGTAVRACLPVSDRTADRSAADQVAS
jgi:glucose-6-phosphate-specific signal transduction histidine kinase